MLTRAERSTERPAQRFGAFVGVDERNVNRSDFAPLEVAAGVAAAIASGSAPDDVARGLGWNRRQLNRYSQLHEAPPSDLPLALLFDVGFRVVVVRA